MRSVDLLQNLDFEGERHARKVHADHDGRVLRWTLSDGEEINNVHAHSPTYVVVLKGQGLFRGGEGEEAKAGPNTMVVFDNGEGHSVRAVGGELVFVAVLHGAPSADGSGA